MGEGALVGGCGQEPDVGSLLAWAGGVVGWVEKLRAGGRSAQMDLFAALRDRIPDPGQLPDIS